MAISSSRLEENEEIRLDALIAVVVDGFGEAVSPVPEHQGYVFKFQVNNPEVLRSLCRFLFWEQGCAFGGIIAEEHPQHWQLHYAFLLPKNGWIAVILHLPCDVQTIPSISSEVHAADWHEREIEDLFGLVFEGHPRLGDFVLHDQVWHEGIDPMRKRFSANQSHLELQANREWRPLLVVKDPGAFAMPVGPVYEGGIGESMHFLLETVGEDVVRSSPRLFYNYRAVEKIAEGRTVNDALLLSERFAATSAFAHSLAFCQAVENIYSILVPLRAQQLRVALCELERLRHHAGAIAGICESTALAVSAAQAAIIEEQLLRASCAFSGSRYLFGLNVPGGLTRDFHSQPCTDLIQCTNQACADLLRLEEQLRYSSSFLDRLEDVGAIDADDARDLNLVGPIGRASAQNNDLRRTCPYSGYERYQFEVPCESEGDGYARLRVLFAESVQSAALIRQATESLEGGPLRTAWNASSAGASIGWVEAPRGAALHWVNLNSQGLIERYHAITPSFNNWLGFHLAAENFAFQDFPIILATFGLSATECDR
jgi:formate hydrogenlyase subunit 5